MIFDIVVMMMMMMMMMMIVIVMVMVMVIVLMMTKMMTGCMNVTQYVAITRIEPFCFQ